MYHLVIRFMSLVSFLNNKFYFYFFSKEERDDGLKLLNSYINNRFQKHFFFCHLAKQSDFTFQC